MKDETNSKEEPKLQTKQDDANGTTSKGNQAESKPKPEDTSACVNSKPACSHNKQAQQAAGEPTPGVGSQDPAKATAPLETLGMESKQPESKGNTDIPQRKEEEKSKRGLDKQC